ncbi:MAG: DNA alkylation repair protein, partial [Oscillospiraceae bacterium]|nr:DNA alkylation repair protein [Oscillospiraceae bacterium]
MPENESNEILAALMSLKDEKYAEFQRKLIPTVAPETIIGVRTPALRKLAKQLSKAGKRQEFLQKLPH